MAFSNTMSAQLANSYPNDVGIETNPSVLFVEKFDDGMMAKWRAGRPLGTRIPEWALAQRQMVQ